MMRSGSSQADDQLPDLAGILGKLGERSQTSRGLKRGEVSAFHGWNVAGISPKAADVRPISTSIFLCRMAQSCALQFVRLRVESMGGRFSSDWRVG
jgi:hypothetical protein